jgi:hypothetical protein
LPDSRDGFIEPPLIASCHDDGSALVHERLRDREADSLRATSDDSHVSIE